jgi:hypothetical protein
MAGLLDDFSEFIKTPGGQGLLSAAFGGLAGARRGAPLNSLGNAGLAGLSGYSGALDRQKQAAEAAQMQEMRKLQMQQAQMGLNAAQANADKEKAFRDAAQRNSIPAQSATPGGLPADMLSALPSEFQTGVQVAPQAARPAGFNYEGYANDISAADPMEAFKVRQMLQKDDAPIKLGAGEQLFSGKASGYKPLLSVPGKESAPPAAIQEYQYAVKNDGYKGTFEQWDTARRRAGATVVNTGDNLGLKPKDRFDMEGKLRADYEGLTKSDREIVSTAQDIGNLLKQGGALKDQAAIYKFAKALDPQGAVRESDYAAIVKTAGGLEYVTSLFNKALTGEQLSPKQRTEMTNISNAMAEVAKNRIGSAQKRTGANARMYNLNPDNLFSPQENSGWSIEK